MSKQVEIANPRTGEARRTSADRADYLCRRGMAYMDNGRLVLTEELVDGRVRSDVYVDRRGVIYWNGARSQYVDGRDLAMFPPCCNVVFPRVGTRRAAQRYAS